METPTGLQTHPLSRLQRQSGNFDFFQAVRLLKRHLPQRQEILFSGNPDLYFPHASIQSVRIEKNLVRIQQNFLNIAGQNGVMPDHIAELLSQRLEAKDAGLWEFLNLFNHRLVQLFYQAWERTHFFVTYEKDPKAVHQDPTLALVIAATGQSRYALKHQALSSDMLIHYSGLFANAVRTREGLIRLLSDYFHLPVRIEEFSGSWLAVQKSECSRIGRSGDYHQLGVNSMLGQRVWHVQNRFVVVIGPLNYSQFLQLLPNGMMLKTMKSIIEFYVGMEFQCQLKLILRKDAVPTCHLESKKPFALGWNTWLKSKRAFTEDAIVTFNPENQSEL